MKLFLPEIYININDGRCSQQISKYTSVNITPDYPTLYTIMGDYKWSGSYQGGFDSVFIFFMTRFLVQLMGDERIRRRGNHINTIFDDHET